MKTICVVDDDVDFNSTLANILRAENFQVVTFLSARLFLEWQANSPNLCDLIITDISMPELSGHDLCQRIRSQSTADRIPIIMITGSGPENGKVAGLDNGADDFIPKPFNKMELMAKIHSLLKIRAHENNRLGRLSRFISPNVASLLLTDADHLILQPHQVEVTVLFIDLRGFTAFSEISNSADVMAVLNSYYTAVGQMTIKYGATLGNMAGDGFMLFFNDPEPVKDHQHRAVEMALELRLNLAALRATWQECGYKIDFGIGLAVGVATIGGIGFDRFWQYSVIGPVANFASRICARAEHGQILVSHRFLMSTSSRRYASESLGSMTLKGFLRVVDVHNILSIEQMQSEGDQPLKTVNRV